MENRVNGAVSVLYVEDDAATRKMVMGVLKMNGFNCIAAGNGREGLELYRMHAPEIVLSDIMMSGMSGLEMARAIRTESSEVPFIFMTAYGESKFILEAIDIGVTQYVVKPVDLHLLLAAISHCVASIRLKTEVQRVKELEAIGILAGGLAHDFNNLLQVVMGYVSLAKKGVDKNSTVFAHLDKAEAKSKEARELGKRLRTFSRGESTLRQKMPLTPLILFSVKAALYGYSISQTFDLPPDLPQVNFDKAQMQQVMTHLTVNAIEAMPHGGNLTVAAHVSRLSRKSNLLLPPGDYVHISFSDTGKGILPENLPKVFYPYFSTKKMDFHKGQGLSLSVCYSIVSRHGGLISANNSSDSGAIFNVWLPVADETIP
jgi:signal transduction histidine kinase